MRLLILCIDSQIFQNVREIVPSNVIMQLDNIIELHTRHATTFTIPFI